MEKNAKIQTVVQGEAPESDDDEVHVSPVKNPTPYPPGVPQINPAFLAQFGRQAAAGGQAVVVAGEASESEEEEVDTSQHGSPELPPLRGESNWQLHDHMVEVGGQAYHGAARSLSGTTTQLLKSHSIVQDVSHSMRLLTNDLFHLDDRIDIILSCKLLPDICIPTPGSLAEPGTSQAQAS
ncbi:hypothetical protein BaRGS_00013946 [Batillaria attramentaria]|uniref:Biogenesis of lysosome-related organelles complex 1 subunit 3 n=1 Tax=Batillaria attramentaria TaxID=370345 RepID=A0ABD0L5F8_9CAEN